MPLWGLLLRVPGALESVGFGCSSVDPGITFFAVEVGKCDVAPRFPAGSLAWFHKRTERNGYQPKLHSPRKRSWKKRRRFD